MRASSDRTKWPQWVAAVAVATRSYRSKRYTRLSRRNGETAAPPAEKINECELAHTVLEHGPYILIGVVRSPGCGLRACGAMEGAMWKAILRNKSVPRAEIDQRARDARLRLEQIERLLASRALP